ncbi:bifunctional riboflavin kinase/FAD synthetase [Paenibacillus crassostreae]|uniref:Riboflavin biosynthesis protein n=1 Tax=Paenibacillus crassostreae TaxID=1763538 RepID=A0A167FM02_9BACL|nr:bifunctional riboflavin kinase/FAD synthetase [Paenibacillus crassostreae]AOZ94268.1 riboflavin biosynthesis protein RibF [Paenibacillus crassostreae]OAB76696.1 bifunctional riboflavin kinase/FMN adenylyltransferase [Paenibacillus crassostreae]
MKTVFLSYPLSSEMLLERESKQVVAIGQFDGIHLGHISVISNAIALAKEKELPSAVVTFNPHPKEVMGKGNYEGYLTPLRDKQELLADMGIDTLYVAQFDEEFSRVSPQDFFTDVLLPLDIDTVVVGFDFRFGYLGAGDVVMLRELGSGNMNVEVAPPYLLDGEKVSSSSIRRALQSGDLQSANHLFGRNYKIRGIVIDGEKRGRTIGFPTANLKLDDRYVIPAKGVYAVRAYVHQKWIPGVMNVGVKPTFHDNVIAPSYEVHLFHFNENVYGEHLTVELVHFLREERRFPSIQELIEQIQADAKQAEELLMS